MYSLKENWTANTWNNHIFNQVEIGKNMAQSFRFHKVWDVNKRQKKFSWQIFVFISLSMMTDMTQGQGEYMKMQTSPPFSFGQCFSLMQNSLSSFGLSSWTFLNFINKIKAENSKIIHLMNFLIYFFMLQMYIN